MQICCDMLRHAATLKMSIFDVSLWDIDSKLDLSFSLGWMMNPRHERSCSCCLVSLSLCHFETLWPAVSALFSFFPDIIAEWRGHGAPNYILVGSSRWHQVTPLDFSLDITLLCSQTAHADTCFRAFLSSFRCSTLLRIQRLPRALHLQSISCRRWSSWGSGARKVKTKSEVKAKYRKGTGLKSSILFC